MQSISVSELKRMMEEEADFRLIDVREPEEHQAFNIGGELIPFGQVMDHAAEFAEDRPVVLYCEKGIRSMIAIQRLLQKNPSLKLINLNGGMSAWRRES